MKILPAFLVEVRLFPFPLLYLSPELLPAFIPVLQFPVPLKPVCKAFLRDCAPVTREVTSAQGSLAICRDECKPHSMATQGATGHPEYSHSGQKVLLPTAPLQALMSSHLPEGALSSSLHLADHVFPLIFAAAQVLPQI